jgi:hypothetical protein
MVNTSSLVDLEASKILEAAKLDYLLGNTGALLLFGDGGAEELCELPNNLLWLRLDIFVLEEKNLLWLPNNLLWLRLDIFVLSQIFISFNFVFIKSGNLSSCFPNNTGNAEFAYF